MLPTLYISHGSPMTAVMDSPARRFLQTLGGLLPLALENSALYSPLAWVIIGGLVTSTVLTRLVTPVVYKLLAPAIEPLPSTPAALPALA